MGKFSKKDLKDLFAELFAEPKKSDKATPKYILVVNGRVITERIANKKAVLAAVTPLIGTAADIKLYKLEGDISFDIPVNLPGTVTEEAK